jgi:hypothetical protein
VVNALDLALRKALRPFYPVIDAVSLIDYKVRIMDGHDATAARTRVVDREQRRHRGMGDGGRVRTASSRPAGSRWSTGWTVSCSGASSRRGSAGAGLHGLDLACRWRRRSGS